MPKPHNFNTTPLHSTLPEPWVPAIWKKLVLGCFKSMNDVKKEELKQKLEINKIWATKVVEKNSTNTVDHLTHTDHSASIRAAENAQIYQLLSEFAKRSAANPNLTDKHRATLELSELKAMSLVKLPFQEELNSLGVTPTARMLRLNNAEAYFIERRSVLTDSYLAAFEASDTIERAQAQLAVSLISELANFVV